MAMDLLITLLEVSAQLLTTLLSNLLPACPAEGRHPLPYELMEKAGSHELSGEMGECPAHI
jgi:hypothetical protein